MNHQTLTVPEVIPQVAYQSPQAPTQLMTKSPFVDSGFAVPVFSLGDDLIACLNKAMAFLTVVASLRLTISPNVEVFFDLPNVDDVTFELRLLWSCLGLFIIVMALFIHAS
ncbi:hypothetical protein Tco_0509106 [Tanacetum coccineum]